MLTLRRKSQKNRWGYQNCITLLYLVGIGRKTRAKTILPQQSQSYDKKRLKRDCPRHLLNHITYLTEINTQFISKGWNTYSIFYSLENKGVDVWSKIIFLSCKMAEALKWFCRFSLVEKENITIVTETIFFLIGKDSVTLNQVVVPIVKFSFLESIRRNLKDLIISSDKRERSFGINGKKLQK